MGRCFTWFPNWLVLGEPYEYHHLVYFTRTRDSTWRVSDCEELVGVQFLYRFKTNYFTQKFHSVFRLTANLSIANLRVVTILTA